MEVIGSPLRPQWVKISGVPLHARGASIFWLVGDCLGRTLEINPRTSSNEIILHVMIKVLLGKVIKLLVQIPLQVGDLQISLLAKEDVDIEGVRPEVSLICSDEPRTSNRGSFHRMLVVGDDKICPRRGDISPGCSKFEKFH